MNDAPYNSNRQTRWGIRSTDQWAVAVITTAALAVLVVSWVYQGGLRGRLIDIDHAEPTSLDFKLDVNTADWTEWTLLPGIGESMAKRIVQDRSDRGGFESHDDLRRVSGIGPRTIDRMRPYLLPIPDESNHPDKADVARQ